MQNYKTLAFGTAAVMAVFIGSCAIPQPRFECNANTPFFAVYTLTSGSNTSSCGQYGGDLLYPLRYLAPTSTEATMSILPSRHSVNRRAQWGARTDASDPKSAREAALGQFATLLPDERGVCSLINVADGNSVYEASVYEIDPSVEAPIVEDGVVVAIQALDEDGGVLLDEDGHPVQDPVYGNLSGQPVVNADGNIEWPALALSEKWENVRILSTAEYPGTLLDADLTITENACTATYHVYGVYPPVVCETDADCDPNADTANGRPFGSGMAEGYGPKCMFLDGRADEASWLLLDYGALSGTAASPASLGVCFPTKKFDELLDR